MPVRSIAELPGPASGVSSTGMAGEQESVGGQEQSVQQQAEAPLWERPVPTPAPVKHTRRNALALLFVPVAGVIAYFVYGAAVTGAPHCWVVTLYTMSTAAFLGALVCDRWLLLRTLVRGVVGRIPSPGNLLDSVMAQFTVDQLGQELDELRRELAALRKQRERDVTRIATLEAALVRASSVTGALLELVGIVLALVASVLWAANLA